DQWYVHSHDGQDYGPISKAELDQWVADGLISADCQLRQGAGAWHFATDVYADSASAGSSQQAPVAASAPAAQPVTNYQRILTLKKGSASLATAFIHRAVQKLGRGNSVTNSKLYQVGAARSFWEQVKAGTIVGPLPKKSKINIDQLH